MCVVFALSSCGGGEAATGSTSLRSVDSMGRELFEERVVGVNPGCVTCHSLEAGVTIVGPSLHEVVSRIPAMSDRDYIRESILDPDRYVVDGFSAGQMNSGWGDYLNEQQIESLVDFLLTRS